MNSSPPHELQDDRCAVLPPEERFSVTTEECDHLTETEQVTGQHLQGKDELTGCPTGGRRGFFFGGPDGTTWIRHCSTCLLISSSLPANGALHSGHTCPPSSGFLLFIFPMRARKTQKENKQITLEFFKTGNPWELNDQTVLQSLINSIHIDKNMREK